MPEKSRLMPISYYNPKQEIRLSAYADTIVLEPDGREQHLRAIRFGGYPEMVRAMSDAIYAGATLETEFAGETAMLTCEPKKYECHLSHDGIYAEATILSLDDADETRSTNEEEMGGQTNVELPPRKCILFCPAGDRQALFEALDRKTAVPLIPEFQDYVLDELQRRRFLKPLRVISIRERLEAWLLLCKKDDANIVKVLEDGLKTGAIRIPGTVQNLNGFDSVHSVTSYLWRYMMKKYFRTLQNVLDSRWGNFQYAGMPTAQKTDRVLQSSKLEDCIYRDLSRDDEKMENIQQEAASKLHSFPALSRDIFQSFYSLFPKRNDTEKLTAEAQKFNAKLLDHVTEDTDYPTIKSICEGRELPAYEAASEFTVKIGAQLDGLLSELGGEDGTLKTLEKLQATRNQAQQKLTELLEQMRDSVQNPTLEQAVIDAANQAESKTQQAEAVAKMVDTTARQNKAAITRSFPCGLAALQCRRRRNLTFQKGGAPSGLSEAADPGSRQTVRACPQRPNASQRGS